MQKGRSWFQVIDSISEWSGKVLSFLLLAMVGIVTYEVIMRYAFNRPTLWVHETSMFMLVGIGFLAGAYTFLYKEHVDVDILRKRIPPRAGAIIDLVIWLFFFLFCGIMLWQGSLLFWSALTVGQQTESAFAPYLWPAKLTIPIGAALILLQGMSKYVRTFRTAIKGTAEDSQ